MNVIIAGCRTFNDYKLLKREVESFAGPLLSKVTVVSGHASGADKLGERFEEEKWLGFLPPSLHSGMASPVAPKV